MPNDLVTLNGVNVHPFTSAQKLASKKDMWHN